MINGPRSVAVRFLPVVLLNGCENRHGFNEIQPRPDDQHNFHCRISRNSEIQVTWVTGKVCPRVQQPAEVVRATLAKHSEVRVRLAVLPRE